jgi:hypothetical protein
MQVAPDKARTRREAAAKDARVEWWPEHSGNAALAGRELPPAAVLAADQRVTAWAKELRAAGLDGTMDELRARAYLDLLLGVDSRPAPPAKDNQDGQTGRPAVSPAAGPLAGVVPPGFAARVNLTTPLHTLTGLASRPGELDGLGPVDPWLARDLARAAARSPRTTWCLTVTDEHGHAIGHGCARPGPRNRQRKRAGPGPRDGPDPPGGSPGTGFTVTACRTPGSPDGYGTWRLSAGIPGHPDLTAMIEPVAIDTCDHRHQATGHDPGVTLRHLTKIRHATCTAPTCRRPAARCDLDHSVPYEAGGRTCMCNTGPKCRRHHRLKQHTHWKADQITPGTVRWTTPSGRTYDTEPTRYPI